MGETASYFKISPMCFPAITVEEPAQRIKEESVQVVESFYIPQAVYQFTLVEVTVNVFTRFPSTSSKIVWKRFLT